MGPSPRPRKSWAAMPCSTPSRETRRSTPPGPLCACTSSTGQGGKGSARFGSCVSWPRDGAVTKGAGHERRTSTGRHAKGSLHSDSGRKARPLECQRPALRGLGDLPHEGIPRRSEPPVRVADQRVVRPSHPALLRRRQDVGDAGRRGHGTGPKWQPGAGGMCLHTILLDPTNARRMYVAISAAGAFRSDDGGKTWKPINRGLRSQYIPDPAAEVGHCVHRIALHRSRPGVLFMQKHWDVMRSDDAGDSWREVSGNLPTDFGFVIDVHAHEPETVYVIPIKSDSEHYVPDGKLRVYRSRKGGNEREALTKGLPQQDCYVNVLRDAMAVDSLEPCGVYFGTTGGQVYASADAGDSWAPIVRDLPAVLSVEVQTLR